MDDEILEHYQNELRSREEWGTSELADFFDVSPETIRRRIRDGTITARQEETRTGTVWRVDAGEIVRNLAQEETLQGYLSARLEDEHRGASQDPSTGGETPPAGSQGASVVASLLEEVRSLRERVEALQEEKGELREELGEARARIESLEKENEELRAELERRPRPNALPAKIEEGRDQVLEQVEWWSSTLASRIRWRLSKGFD